MRSEKTGRAGHGTHTYTPCTVTLKEAHVVPVASDTTVTGAVVEPVAGHAMLAALLTV